jgi:hypothetical protein
MAFKAVVSLVGVATTLDVALGASKHRSRQLTILARQKNPAGCALGPAGGAQDVQGNKKAPSPKRGEGAHARQLLQMRLIKG